MDETKHWLSLKAGNTDALEALYKQYVDPLYSYGMVLCNDHDKVKDSIHDLFIALWSGRERLAIPDSGKAYLMISLRRKLFDKGSKMQSMMDDTEITDQLSPHEADHERVLIYREEEAIQNTILEGALLQLSDRQREIIYMRYYEQMEYDEIGRLMGLNYQSARNLVTRALAVMRKKMLAIVILLLMFV